MGHKLTVHSKRSFEGDYWFNSIMYNRNIIDDIIDPSDGNIDKLLTAIPSPFAQMHLFDTAFGFARYKIKSENVFNKLVSDCFDLFELLFNFKAHLNAGFNLSIISWDFEENIKNLMNSKYKSHKRLGDVLQKYFLSNDLLKANPTIFIFLLDQEAFGGTSPFTGFFTGPDIKDFSIKNTRGIPYFSKIIPIWERDEELLIALYSFFSPKNPELISSAKNVFEYLNSAVEFIKDNSLKTDLKNLLNNFNSSRKINVTDLNTDSGAPVKVCNASIKVRQEVIKIHSPLTIASPKTPEYCNNIKPLVLRDGRDHYDNNRPNIRIPVNVGNINKIDHRILPDSGITYPYLVVDDFLEDSLIRLNYPVNEKYFITPNFDKNNEDEHPGFLLPVKKEYFDFFDTSDLKQNLRIFKIGDNDFKVELNIPIISNEVVTFRKYYYEEPKSKDAGKLVITNCYFAFFPLFKVKDNDEFNDYYKIMMVDDEYELDNVVLKIFDEENIEISDNLNADKHYKRVIRNEKRQNNFGGSYYYETNFPYKFLELNFSSQRNNRTNIKGLIIPSWPEIDLGNRKFNVAVDFGTTNTHVVLLEKIETRNSVPESFTIDENELQTVLFNKYKNDSNLSLTERYERWNSVIETRLIQRQIHEFIPSIIGKGSNPKYSFPIRTAISTSNNYVSHNSNLLGNINISFIFEKDVQRTDERIQTNLKWEITDGVNEKKVEEFIKEILYLVRNKILLNNGNPKETKLLWFKPLSMYQGHQAHYERIWNENLRKIFKPTDITTQTVCLTESCAPFFYYEAQNRAQGSRPVLVIDIGGGSTDVSFFLNNNPEFGISFNFAGDTIWNPGLERRHRVAEGIFLKYGLNYISSLNQNSDSESLTHVRDIFKSQFASETQSGNLFNFYFTWDDKIGFTNELRRDPKIKFLILFHFSSIIYHCIYLLKEKGYNPPEYICLSGRGSRYLSILDPTHNLDLINGFLPNYVKDIYDNSRIENVKIERVDQEKEATCIGGLYLLEKSMIEGRIKDTPKSEPYLGEEKPSFREIIYQNIDDNLKNSVAKNFKRFLDVFFKQNSNFNFSQNFLINLDKKLTDYKDELKRNTLNYLELGLNKRLQTVNPTDNVNEPLFFYPIISMIYELSREFYGPNQN